MDATRVSDGSIVTMKKLEMAIHPYELDIGTFLSSDTITSDPRSHCVRIFETLSDPIESDVSIIVMPYLRPYDDPPFQTVGEVIACFKQLIEVCCILGGVVRELETTTMSGSACDA